VQCDERDDEVAMLMPHARAMPRQRHDACSPLRASMFYAFDARSATTLRAPPLPTRDKMLFARRCVQPPTQARDFDKRCVSAHII